MDGHAKSARFLRCANFKSSLTPWLVAAILVTGCGRSGPASRVEVSGTVLLDGIPLSHGVVRFVPVDGAARQKWAVPVQDGIFLAGKGLGPIVGEHRIEIESTNSGEYASDDEDALAQLQASGKKIRVSKVPAWYGRGSPIRETVTLEGPNQFHFNLTSKR